MIGPPLDMKSFGITELAAGNVRSNDLHNNGCGIALVVL